jgi:hypothetical protein
VPRRGWILRHERALTWGLVLASVLAVAAAAALRYGPGRGSTSGTSGRTTTTLGLGESLGAGAETSGPSYPKGRLHPGALDARVTQANVASTICRPGWVNKVRPGTGFLDDLRRRQLQDEGHPGTVADYDEDHLVPLELGGAPKDPKNLWPEPWENRGSRLAAAGTGAESKDTVEKKLHGEVCSGELTLKLARQTIAANWQLAGTQL